MASVDVQISFFIDLNQLLSLFVDNLGPVIYVFVEFGQIKIIQFPFLDVFLEGSQVWVNCIL